MLQALESMKILLEFWPITFFMAKRGTGLLEVLPYLSHAFSSELQSPTLTKLETVMTVMRGKIRAFSTHRRSFISGFFHITNPFVEAFNFLLMFFAISDCMIKKALEKLFIFFFRLSLKILWNVHKGTLRWNNVFFLCLSLEGTAKYKFDWKDRDKTGKTEQRRTTAMTGFEKIYKYDKWRTRKILKNDQLTPSKST